MGVFGFGTMDDAEKVASGSVLWKITPEGKNTLSVRRHWHCHTSWRGWVSPALILAIPWHEKFNAFPVSLNFYDVAPTKANFFEVERRQLCRRFLVSIRRLLVEMQNWGMGLVSSLSPQTVTCLQTIESALFSKPTCWCLVASNGQWPLFINVSQCGRTTWRGAGESNRLAGQCGGDLINQNDIAVRQAQPFSGA